MDRDPVFKIKAGSPPSSTRLALSFHCPIMLLGQHTSGISVCCNHFSSKLFPSLTLKGTVSLAPSLRSPSLRHLTQTSLPVPEKRGPWACGLTSKTVAALPHELSRQVKQLKSVWENWASVAGLINSGRVRKVSLDSFTNIY